MADSQYGFPTEVLSLPSKGLLYPKDSPLHEGTVDVKYMTAKEEDILTSTNLIQKGVVIDKLMESVIADSKIKLNDLLIGDKNALMVGTRLLGYGKEYPVQITDPDTGEVVDSVVDLTTIEHKKVDFSLFEKGENRFTYTLPNSKRVVEFKLLTQGDEEQIENKLKSYAKVEQLTGVSSELTTRLKYQIISVDGSEDEKVIDNFVDNEFLALDTREFRKHLNSITPDLDLMFTYESTTGTTHKIAIPLGIDFFWPAGE